MISIDLQKLELMKMKHSVKSIVIILNGQLYLK